MALHFNSPARSQSRDWIYSMENLEASWRKGKTIGRKKIERTAATVTLECAHAHNEKNGIFWQYSSHYCPSLLFSSVVSSLHCLGFLTLRKSFLAQGNLSYTLMRYARSSQISSVTLNMRHPNSFIYKFSQIGFLP